MNYFDCHADTLTEIHVPDTLWKNANNLDLERVKAFASKYVQVFALWKDAKSTTNNDCEAEFTCIYQKIMQLLAAQQEHISLCRTGREMETALRAKKAAAFLAIEDISLMGSQVERIKELGFTVAMLTWNYENQYATGAAYNQKSGLTEAGKDLVRSLIRQNIRLDISHLSDAGVEDILELTDAPIIASHSNARECCENPRNLTKVQIQEIIRRNGLIGINFYAPFVNSEESATMKDIFTHMDYILGLGGEAVLAIGSDFDGCSNRFPNGITGVESIPKIQKEMRKAGFSETIIEKIFFANAYQFFKEI